MSVVQTNPSARLRVQRTLPFDRAAASRRATPEPSVPGRRPLVLAELPAAGLAAKRPAPAVAELSRVTLPARIAPVLQVVGTAFVFAVCLLAVAYF